jgi:prolyl-tRNA synthetase
MHWKDAFIFTLREVPADAETISHKLLLRAGMIQKLAAGIYSYLPPGLRVIRKIEAIVRDEMSRCNATELLMPMVIPSELWRESGRWEHYGPELLRLLDRKNSDYCLGPTHEEVIVDVVRRTVRSYRDLPRCLYQIQTKFRDEVRPRFGLMRGREFIMKDAYSFHADERSLDEMYCAMHAAYTNIFKRCGLTFRPVEADSGAIGGSVTHEFHVLADSGEDTIAYCASCDYAANIEKAYSFRGPPAGPATDNPSPLEEVATPEKKSIEEVCAFLSIPSGKTVKMLVYEVNGGEYLCAVCIRGDLEVNEIKLKGLLGAASIEIPDEETLRQRTGMPIGFLGPCNASYKALKEIIADDSVKDLHDFVCGANREGFHLMHGFAERDLTGVRFVDIGFVKNGDICPKCKNGRLALRKGIEVGHVFKLGQKYAKSMSLTFLNESNTEQLMTMGCYGIGIGRTAAAAVEQNNDKDGIIWPVPIAPFTIALLCLDTTSECIKISGAIHDDLSRQGIDILFDDREERPGVKFKDADLIGCPLRVTVGARGLKEGIIEVKWREAKEHEKIPKDLAHEKIFQILNNKLGNRM